MSRLAAAYFNRAAPAGGHAVSAGVEPADTPSVNMRPLAPEAEPGVGLPIVQEMLRRAAAVLPGMRQVAAEAVRIGARAIPADGLSTVGAMPDIDGYYVVVPGSRTCS